MSESRAQRLMQLTDWVRQQPGLDSATLTVASADASFRQYYRIQQGDRTLIAMDAPPDKEDTRPFIAVTHLLRNADVRAPAIHAENQASGFLLLDDLGIRDLLPLLNTDTVDQHYWHALESLIKIQQADTSSLPSYDATLLRNEMQLFPDWFLARHLQITLTDAQSAQLSAVCNTLANNALEQPQVFVHRDYHSRNLMVIDDGEPGVIDYQDAVLGPVTYDLVSLLRDCYIDWEPARVESWALAFKQQLQDHGQLTNVSDANFLRWFDLMGIQRHLKAIGIFSRLNHRDGKPDYLKEIPRTLNYVITVSGKYPETAFLVSLAEELDLSDHIQRSIA